SRKVTSLHHPSKFDKIFRVPILYFIYLSEYYYIMGEVKNNENKTIIFFQRCDWSHVVCIVFRSWKSYFSSRVRASIWNKSFTSNYWFFNYRNWFTVVGSTSDCLFRK